MSDIPIPYYGKIEQKGGNYYPLLSEGLLNKNGIVARAEPVFINRSDGQLLGGPFGKYNVNNVPVPLLGLNQHIMITSSEINRFENYNNIKDDYKNIRSELGSSTRNENRKDGYVEWKDSKITHKVKDESTSPDILYTYVKLSSGVVPGVNNRTSFFDPVTRILKVRGNSVETNYNTLLDLLGVGASADKLENRSNILSNVV